MSICTIEKEEASPCRDFRTICSEVGLDNYNNILYNTNKISIIKRGIYMQISPAVLEKEVYARFPNIYKAFGDFIDSGELWNACLAAIRDSVLLGHIIFCNDIHQIPPVHTFLRANQSIRRNLTELEKRSIGAFWGFVFKFVFGYRNQKSVTARANTVKTASYFFDAPENIEIVCNTLSK